MKMMDINNLRQKPFYLDGAKGSDAAPADGVNWTFSPVADICFNYRNPITNVRTFGSDTDRNLENLRIFTRTIQKYGIAASCKHYPGDGVDHRDQHLHPTYNDLPAAEWFETYGRTYKTLIDEGLMSIMAGHIIQPNVIKYVNPDAGEEDMLPGSQSGRSVLRA